jgi:Ni/Co efflux regulator RcnB
VDECTEIRQSTLTFMATEHFKDTIKRELPALFCSDRALRRCVLDLTKERYAERHRREGRFNKILDKLRRDRAERARKRGHDAPQRCRHTGCPDAGLENYARLQLRAPEPKRRWSYAKPL